MKRIRTFINGIYQFKFFTRVIISAGLLLGFLLASCQPAPTTTPPPTIASTEIPTITPTLPLPEDTPTTNSPTRTPFVYPTSEPVGWFELLQRTPVPWTTPLPPDDPTPLDGVYTRVDPSEPMWWNCMRCADYLPTGGLWKISLRNGIFHIYYPMAEWRSLGSYTVEGDQLVLFNDPYCQYEVGTYTWRLEEGQLTLTPVEDTCSFNMRQANLGEAPWQACQPPNIEAGISGHWEVPEGCEE